MQPFRILSSTFIIDEPYCRIEKQRVVFPDGTEGDWFIKRNNDAVIVLPMDADGRVLLQRCYKHGCGEVVTEFCAGLIDDGETPAEAAHRELTEETGLTAETMEKIGSCFASPTGVDMSYHFFIAHNCGETGIQNLESAEQIETFWVDGLDKAKEILTAPDTQTGTPSLALLSFLSDRKF